MSKKSSSGNAFQSFERACDPDQADASDHRDVRHAGPEALDEQEDQVQRHDEEVDQVPDVEEEAEPQKKKKKKNKKKKKKKVV